MYFTRLVLYIHFVTTTRANSQKLVVFLRKKCFLSLFIYIYLFNLENFGERPPM